MDDDFNFRLPLIVFLHLCLEKYILEKKGGFVKKCVT